MTDDYGLCGTARTVVAWGAVAVVVLLGEGDHRVLVDLPDVRESTISVAATTSPTPNRSTFEIHVLNGRTD